MMARCLRTMVVLTGLLLATPESPRAEIVPEESGTVLRLAPGADPHRVWVADRMFRHSILFDGDTGVALGMLDITWSLGGQTPCVSRERGEIYVVEPVYSRGHRGERKDYVTIYDALTLQVVGEVELPTKSADIGHGVALATILDGGRFLVIFNQTPATSVSVVDLPARRFAGEIQTAGCAMVYATGPRSFGMLCGDGTALRVDLDELGQEARSVHSLSFFDAVTDPLTEKGARDGNRWLFASFEGYLHEIDFSGERPKPGTPWDLFSKADREDSWRVGGIQHLAVHRDRRSLYSLVHQGGAGTHKDSGSEIWVYDLESRTRIQIMDVPKLLPGLLRPIVGVEAGGVLDWFLRLLLPNLGAHSIVVTQDSQPLLFVRHGQTGAVGVLNATTGEHLRDLEESGISGGTMALP